VSERWTFSRGRAIGLGAGIVAYVALGWMVPGLEGRAAVAAAVTALMATWWVTDALPMSVTAAMPVILFPLNGMFGGGLGHELASVLGPYLHPYIFLFMGGMGIGAAMQQSGLHRRIAVQIMRLIGTGPERLLLGILCATAFVSLWISNTATAAMMLPIGLAIVRQLELRTGIAKLELYGSALMMAIAYGANIGGLGTKIGTAPNAQLVQFLQVIGIEVSFLQFSLVGLPFVVIMLPIAWWLLWRVARPDGARLGDVGKAALEAELIELGITKRREWWVLGVFLTTALIWILGQPLTGLIKDHYPPMNSAKLEGGASMIAMAVLMLVRVEGRALLELKTMLRQPWSSLLLLGGSFAMAEAIQTSGLSDQFGRQFATLGGLDPFWQILAASVLTVALSAIASNVATTSVMLNVLRSSVTPTFLPTILFAATIAASCDFALPAGTPPNAIVFASGYLTIPRMAKTGAILDLIAAVVAAIWCYAIVRLVI
jgi:solute carrier family 13 (sodium-dependent dicarboxylate transporter), member 2/3/5